MREGGERLEGTRPTDADGDADTETRARTHMYRQKTDDADAVQTRAWKCTHRRTGIHTKERGAQRQDRQTLGQTRRQQKTWTERLTE